MTVVVLSPHNDDAELFCAYQVIREHAYVVVCLRSQVQAQRGAGITYLQREAETEAALQALGVSAYEQWEIPDDTPDYEILVTNMIHLELRLSPTKVFAPAIEEGGHDQHNMVGEIATSVFRTKVVPYMTYVRGQGRSHGGVEILPTTAEMLSKREALDLHASQIGLSNTRYWFLDGSEWWREWLQ